MSNEMLFVSRDLFWPICEKRVLEEENICVFKFSIAQIEEEKELSADEKLKSSRQKNITGALRGKLGRLQYLERLKR